MNIKLFGDVCMLRHTIGPVTDHELLSDNLTKVATWCNGWGMSLLTIKSVVMIKKIRTAQHTYYINNYQPSAQVQALGTYF